jgi:hypothetical protein
MKVANSEGLDPTGMLASSRSRSRTLVDASAFTAYSFNLLIAASGVLAGTSRPNHWELSNPG